MPDWTTQVEDEVASLRRLLGVALTLAAVSHDAGWAGQAAALAGRLRRLFFAPGGGFEVLKRAAAGRPVQRDDLDALRALRGQFEPEAEAAARRLRLMARRRGITLERDDLAALEGLVRDRTRIGAALEGIALALETPGLNAEALQADAAFLAERLAPLGPRAQAAEEKLAALARAWTAEAAGRGPAAAGAQGGLSPPAPTRPR